MIITDEKSPEIGINKWTVTLNNGTRVFEDKIPKQPSSWHRLREHLDERKDCFPVGMELFAYGVHLTMPPDADGYFQSKRVRRFIGMPNETLHDHGIGYVKGNKIHIKWICPDQHVMKENRELNSCDPAVIFSQEMSKKIKT